MWQRLRELLIIGLSVLTGIVISSLFEKLLNPSVSFPTGWLDLFLLVLFGTFGVMVWFIIGSRSDLDKTRTFIERVIEGKIDQIGTSVEYVEEEWVDEHSRTGKILDKELDYTGKAEQEILMLVNLSVSPTVTPAEDVRRAEYLKALEESILKHKDTGFKYIRISQAPEGTTHPQFLPITNRHFKRIFEMRQKCPALELELMVVNTTRDFSFTIIDGRTLLLEVAGVKTLSGRETRYAIGYFVITDRGGQLIRNFENYFHKMERQARPLTLDDLT